MSSDQTVTTNVSAAKQTGKSYSPQFPRSSDIPRQSPKYWAKEKDRYLRQLLISDIEAETGRPLIVYFSQLDQQITHTDPDDLSEIIQGIGGRSADLLIQTPGGIVDATEKIISLLRKSFDDYRVIVPSWAKSAGTVVALSSSRIVFGINSELGPIDPQWTTNSGTWPCELLAKDPSFPQHVRDSAQLATDRMRELAKQILETGMMSAVDEAARRSVIEKISSSTGYMSHGAVIDYDEANDLGLSVEYLEPGSDLWRRIWLLYCLYDYDSKAKGLGKVFEGNVFSISRPK
jgi:ClpP class serine protease